MGKENRIGEYGFRVVAVSSRRKPGYFAQPANYPHTGPRDRDLRLEDITRLKKICEKCPLRRKCKAKQFERGSFLDQLETVPTVSGYRTRETKCRITRGESIISPFKAD